MVSVRIDSLHISHTIHFSDSGIVTDINSDGTFNVVQLDSSSHVEKNVRGFNSTRSEDLESINSKIIVVPCDTIRAKNGIALSSRNKLLNQKSLNTAGKIINFLKNNRNKIIKSKDNSLFLKKIKEFGVKKIDYLTAFDLKKLKKTNKSTVNTRVFIAYYLNGVRLIDNF